MPLVFPNFWSPFNMTSDITLCIPAYNASPFILETIDSVCNQTYRNFHCIVSVDLSNDDTYHKLSSSLVDKRFTIHRQQRRLGWARNVNYVISKSTSRYVCIMPHDDIIHPTYIDKLLPIIKNDQEIAAVYSDIVQFGDGKEATIKQPSVSGSKLERILDYLNHHYNCVVFRGIVDREKVGDDIYCSSNKFDDFSQDTIWGLKLALHGKLIRHPKILYSKRYLDTSYHHKWQQWDTQKNLAAWAYHCAKCLHILMKDGQLHSHRTEISQAIINRLLQRKAPLWRKSELQDHLNYNEMVPRLITNISGKDG
ncbi:MAG: glycosyltransferase family 2 protein [Saprospiraceae bacterium]|nr:glycosyltransferase family 2 protein [Saprospiraceae bacterium]